jgi:adenosylhomocysteine nucleosidase
MNIVVLISANAEWRAVKELYPDLQPQASPLGEFAHLTLDTRPLTLFHGGWGKISAAATTQYAIDHFAPDLLVNLGTCGGFAGRIETGTVILVEKTIVYDIIEQMGDADEAIAHYSTHLDLSWLADERPSNLRPPTSNLLVSADRDIVAADIPMLVEKYGAVAADWESGAIAWVARRNGVRCLILRGVTDLVSSAGGANWQFALQGGGEAYGNIGLFHERTKTVMQTLFAQLPDWLNAIR